jgi:hypothetical protein
MEEARCSQCEGVTMTTKKKAKPRIAIPADVREAAEFAVDDADAFSHNLLEAEQKVLDAVESDLNVAHANARLLTRKALALATRNVTTFFEYSHRIVSAPDATAALRLHMDFVQKQSEVLAAQLLDFNRAVARAALSFTRE